MGDGEKALSRREGSMKRLRIEELLQRNVWDVGKKPHIEINIDACESCESKLCVKLCPAGCYTVVDGKVLFSYEGCLECGTCRTVCPQGAVKWSYPRSGKGVYYRFT